MKALCFSTLFLCMSFAGLSQDDETEFQLGLSHSIELGQGAADVWQYRSPRSYFNSLHYAPALTLPGNWFRVAPLVGLIYPGNELSILLGIRTSYRVHSGDFNSLGSLYNIHLVAEGWHNEGSILFGGGIGTEVGQLILISFKNLYHVDSRQFWSVLNLGIVLYPRNKKGNDSDHYIPSR